eukprot:6186261-Pleurochrysis_carterae.AAC.1
MVSTDSWQTPRLDCGNSASEYRNATRPVGAAYAVMERPFCFYADRQAPEKDSRRLVSYSWFPARRLGLATTFHDVRLSIAELVLDSMNCCMECKPSLCLTSDTLRAVRR